jgi:hypothetical protein
MLDMNPILGKTLVGQSDKLPRKDTPTAAAAVRATAKA